MAKQNNSPQQLLKYELNLIKSKNTKLIAGVDEVGRGALAGPMVVGAVLLHKDILLQIYEFFQQEANIRNNDVLYQKLTKFTQIKDSKLLTNKKRRELNEFITSECISYSIIEIPAKAIDKQGISRVTTQGFSKAIKNLKQAPDHILTDAFCIQDIAKALQTNIKHGDRLSITIAAASIVAKVYRDTLMETLCEKHPEYKKYLIHQNKAYGTRKHMDAIKKWGPLDIHRKSFEPVKSMLTS